jgi:uncharacterized protein YegL
MLDNGKIQALNNAGREVVPAIRDAAASNKRAEVFVRVLAFGGDCTWTVATPTPIETFEWTDVRAAGGTPLGEALGKLAEQLRTPPMEVRGLPPVVCVVSDGQPTDGFEAGLARFQAEPWAQKAVVACIAIGDDADKSILQRICGFQGESVLSNVLQADNAEQLVALIRWASTSAVLASSSPIQGTSIVAAPPVPTGLKVF